METPLIQINYLYKNEKKSIFTKLEFYNLSGSIKDRVAKYMIDNAIKRGDIMKNTPIVEATSGNTGIALAAYSKTPVYIFMPDWASKERVLLMESLGAKVYLLSKEQGGFKACLDEAAKFAKKNHAYLTNQFANKDNYLAHYETTAEEIIKQMNRPIDAFISGVGTGGTLMGVSDRLRIDNPKFKSIAIEPDKMPLMKEGKMISNHKIEGIGDDFIPDLINLNSIDDIFLINDDDAINMARLIARKLGIGVGISSGANLIGSILANEKYGGNIVTIFPDDNKKYLSTDLSKKTNENINFISNMIELIDYKMI